MAGRKRIDIRTRLYEKIDVRGPNECWPWLACTNNGYGAFSVGMYRKHNAIRIAYELEKGPIPPGMEIDHVCDNKLCCNPAHAEIVTHSENMRRVWRRGKLVGKLWCPAFTAVVAADPRPIKERARIYGVDTRRVSQWTRAHNLRLII